jgi:RNA polymerase sigma-70 factor (ECF subfamily)
VPLTAVLRRKQQCLLRRSRDDPDAFADFYDAYSERILGFLMRRVLDAEVALDLASETFAKALERRRQFRGTTAEEEQAWLVTIARSELSHYWARGKVQREALERLGVPVPGLTDADIERVEELADLRVMADQLHGAIAQLPAEQRQAVQLRIVQELAYHDLARELNITEQTARARVSRGLRALAATLAAAGLVEDAA